MEDLKQTDKSEFDGLWNEIAIGDEIHPSVVGVDLTPKRGKRATPRMRCGPRLGNIYLSVDLTDQPAI